MNLAINTFIYEVGKISLRKALKSINKFGFKYVDLVAYVEGDPTTVKESDLKDVIKMFKEYGFTSSQLLMANTQHIASSDDGKRKKTMDYMKACTDFQLELGGKQVLICWGCGINEMWICREQSWLNTVNMIKEYADWCKSNGIFVGLELDPHVYFVVNNLEKMVKMLEDVNRPNVYPNIDIGHLCLTREPPKTLEKLKEKIIHAHISETDTFEHTNSIIGTGNADIKAYIDKLINLGIEKNCKKAKEDPVVGIEMGEPEKYVEDPERWISESLTHLKKILPELTL